MKTPLFGKEAHQPFEITQRFQQAAFDIRRLGTDPQLFDALGILGGAKAVERQRTPQQKSISEEN